MGTQHSSVGLGKGRGSFGETLYRLFIKEKLNNPLGYILLTLVALSISFAVPVLGLKLGTVVLVAVVGIPVIFACLFNLQFGIVVALIISFFIMGVKKFIPDDKPVGLIMDVLVVVMFFGLFIKQIKERDWSFVKNPISFVVLLWIFYNILLVFNPIAKSRMAWFYSVRAIAGLIILYFVVVYAMKDMKFNRLIFKLIIFLSFLAALYGLWQEFVGLPSFEEHWLRADPLRFRLTYQWGKIRVFSFLSGPMEFGVLMAYMGLFCLVLVTGPFKKWKKFLLVVMGVAMLLAMSYTGTRTAFVMVPIGFFFLTVLTMNRYVIVFMIFFTMIGAVAMNMPTSNTTLYRLQSAFRPQEDASMNTRLRNQAKIQPYIQSHPIGGGLGSTGQFGRRFTPNTMLANFPPDSGFVKIAVEMGWVGLLLYCILVFTALRVGIKNYVRCRDPEIRVYYQAFLVMLFTMVVSNYAQDSIIMLPNSIVFYIALAALVKLKHFDRKKMSLAS